MKSAMKVLLALLAVTLTGCSAATNPLAPSYAVDAAAPVIEVPRTQIAALEPVPEPDPVMPAPPPMPTPDPTPSPMPAPPGPVPSPTPVPPIDGGPRPPAPVPSPCATVARVAAVFGGWTPMGTTIIANVSLSPHPGTWTVRLMGRATTDQAPQVLGVTTLTGTCGEALIDRTVSASWTLPIVWVEASLNGAMQLQSNVHTRP